MKEGKCELCNWDESLVRDITYNKRKTLNSDLFGSKVLTSMGRSLGFWISALIAPS